MVLPTAVKFGTVTDIGSGLPQQKQWPWVTDCAPAKAILNYSAYN